MREIDNYYNIKVKKFGSEKQITVYSKPVITGFSSPLKGRTKEQIIKKTKTINEFKHKSLKSFRSSKTRSKNKIYDCSRSNEWDWFITITFNPDKVNSFDYDACTKKLSQWLKNVRKRYCPDMKYIFVPELHKSGRYHFHGIMADCEGLEFTDSGKRTKTDDVIYNIGKYRYGFTTATKVKDSNRVTKYIGKYITKELVALVKGKKRYWKSRNCNMPEIEYYYNQYESVSENEMDKESVLKNLHFDLVNRDGFVYGSERNIVDSNGKEQFIRYYEFEGDRIDE